jgi:hypothetical protein
MLVTGAAAVLTGAVVAADELDDAVLVAAEAESDELDDPELQAAVRTERPSNAVTVRACLPRVVRFGCMRRWWGNT